MCLSRDRGHAAANRSNEVAVPVRPTTDGVEEDIAQSQRDLADITRADCAAVNGRDMCNLNAGAAKECFVGDIELGTVDFPCFDRNPLVLRELEKGPPGDAFQDIACDRRGDQRSISNDEEIAATSLGNLA